MYLLKIIFLILYVSQGYSNLDELQLNGLERTRTSNVILSASLLRDIICQNPGKNNVLTGLIANYGFGTVANYAKCKHDQERLVKMLNYKCLEQIKNTVPALTKQLQIYNNTISLWTGLIYGDIGRKFSRKFMKDVETFNNFLKSADFKNSTFAARSINRLADINTLGISSNGNLIKPVMIKDDKEIFYIVAHYFEGGLEGCTNPCDTKDMDFQLPSGKKIKLPTMVVQGFHKYGKLDKYGAQLLELPFQGHDFTLRIVIPGRNDDIATIVAEFGDPTLFEEAYSSLHPYNLKCYLPKIEIHKNLNFLESYQKFDRENYRMYNDNPKSAYKDLKAIQLTGIFTDAKKVQITQMLVNFHFKINEGMTNFTNTETHGSDKDPLSVHVNSSMIFYVLDKSGIPMLVGLFTGED